MEVTEEGVATAGEVADVEDLKYQEGYHGEHQEGAMRDGTGTGLVPSDIR